VGGGGVVSGGGDDDDVDGVALCYAAGTGRNEVSDGARSERERPAKHHLRVDRQRRHLVPAARICRCTINQWQIFTSARRL